MAEIAIQFVEIDDWQTKIIQVFERGWPGHVDAVIEGVGLLGARDEQIGNVPAGVQIRPFNYYSWIKACVVTITVTQEQYDAFYAFLNAQIGKPYDMTAVMAFAVERDWHSGNAWFCSELIIAALEAAKIVQLLAVVANEMTPRDALCITSAIASSCVMA